MARAVLLVSFLVCTNINTWFFPACSMTFSYTMSFITWNRKEKESKNALYRNSEPNLARLKFKNCLQAALDSRIEYFMFQRPFGLRAHTKFSETTLEEMTTCSDRNENLSFNKVLYLQSLHWFFLCDTNILLLQRNWPKTVIKEEQALWRIHTHKGCHIFVIW